SAAVARLPWKHFPAPLEPIVVGMLRVTAKPPCRANEAAREAKTTNSAKANFAEMLDMGDSCACRKSNSHVQMMKSAKKWRRQNATNGMYCSRRRRVLVD